MHFCRILLLSTLIAMGLLGCEAKTLVGTPDDSLRPLSQPAAEQATSVSDPQIAREFHEFADSWIERARIGHATLLQDLIDWNEIDRRATHGIACPPYLREDFLRRLDAVRRGPQGFAAGVAATVGAGGSYQFLRFRIKDGILYALFRTVHPNQDFNYHEAELLQRDDDRVVAADIRIVRTGLTFSQIFRDSFIEFLMQKDPSLREGLSEPDRDYALDLPIARRMSEFLSQGRAKEAMDEYRKLRPSVQSSHKAMIQRLSAAIALSEEEGERAIADYQAAFPGSETDDLVAASGWFERKQFPKAVEAIDRFEASIGSDPYLHVFRSRCYLASGVVYRARQEAEKAIEDLPDLIDGYEAMLAIAVRDKDHVYTAEMVDRIVDRFRRNPEEIMGRPELAEFTRSRAYKEWTQRRRQRMTGVEPTEGEPAP